MYTHRYPTPQALAEALADWLVELMAAQPGPFHLALSGGSTPQLWFKVLAQDAFRQRLNWAQLHLYWGDERCVPPHHPDSNFGVADSLLLSGLPQPRPHLHRIRGEDEPEAEAKRYAAEVAEHVPTVDGLPRFDLVLLGLGDDGHTASIFPHQAHLLTLDAWTAVATHPLSGQKRISLTGKVLNAAKRVAFLATGAGKAQKIQEILTGEVGSLHYPATWIRPVQGELHWWMDEPAASLWKDQPTGG